MTDLLRAEVVPPPRKSAWLLVAAPLVAQLAVMATCERSERTTVFVPPAMPRAVQAPAPRVLSSELHLVFRDSDRTYMQIDSENQVRIGDKFFVDNDCIATVVDYATITRVAGDVEVVGPEDGAKVLSAALDRCDGTYARSIALPIVVVPETRPDDARLVKQAKRMLLGSPAADATTVTWQTDFESNDDWKPQAQYDIRTLYHPLTHETWISIHAFNEAGCGEAPINVWGLFRVESDGSLTATQLRELGDVKKIDQIIDIEGDGELELIGTEWLGLEKIVTGAGGDQIDRLPLPYIGCPC